MNEPLKGKKLYQEMENASIKRHSQSNQSSSYLKVHNIR